RGSGEGGVRALFADRRRGRRRERSARQRTGARELVSVWGWVDDQASSQGRRRKERLDERGRVRSTSGKSLDASRWTLGQQQTIDARRNADTNGQRFRAGRSSTSRLLFD